MASHLFECSTLQLDVVPITEERCVFPGFNSSQLASLVYRACRSTCKRSLGHQLEFLCQKAQAELRLNERITDDIGRNR